jgi:hypothetical protein
MKEVVKVDMSVVSNIILDLEVTAVLRRGGFTKPSKVRPEIKSIVFELLNYVKEAHLLEPVMAYKIYSASEIGRRQIFKENNTQVPGTQFHSLIAEAEEFAVVVCTIGPRLEKQVTDYSKGGETLRAMLLDSIGSAAVDSLTHEVCKFIAGEASSRGYQVSSPINPGMPGLHIAEQWQLLKLVSAREIGVSLTSSGMMVPQKSTSMLIGLGPKMPTWTQAEICARCSLRKSCLYRIHT